jgi:hypothetical protein
MNSITFNNTQFHLNDVMAEWCSEYVGPGRWGYDTPKTWDGMDSKVWVMHSMFGNTTFAFKNEKDYTWFLLRWSHA